MYAFLPRKTNFHTLFMLFYLNFCNIIHILFIFAAQFKQFYNGDFSKGKKAL